LDIHGAYNDNLGGEYKFGGPNKDYISVTELEQGLQNYYTSKYTSVGGSLTYSQQVKESEKINMFAKVAFDRMSTSDYKFDNRSYMTVSLGCNF
jgi:hypothetical protein